MVILSNFNPDFISNVQYEAISHVTLWVTSSDATIPGGVGGGGRVALFIEGYDMKSWSGGSVGIATDYGLDGPGSNPGGDETLRPSRPALSPTQPPVKRVAGLSRG